MAFLAVPLSQSNNSLSRRDSEDRGDPVINGLDRLYQNERITAHSGPDYRSPFPRIFI